MTPAKQQVATVRDTDTSAKELFVYHNAGKAGQSADPKLILRDIDGNGTTTARAKQGRRPLPSQCLP